MGTMRILRQIRFELSLVSTMQLISVLIYMVIHVYQLCHLALEHNLEHFMRHYFLHKLCGVFIDDKKKIKVQKPVISSTKQTENGNGNGKVLQKFVTLTLNPYASANVFIKFKYHLRNAICNQQSVSSEILAFTLSKI